MWGSVLRSLRILLLKLYFDQNYDYNILACLRKKRSFLMLMFKAWSSERLGSQKKWSKRGLAAAAALSPWDWDVTWVWVIDWKASCLATAVKNPPASAGDVRDSGSIPGSRRSPGGGNGNPLQDSCWDNPRDREAWQAIMGSQSQTRLKWLSVHTHHSHTLSTTSPH